MILVLAAPLKGSELLMSKLKELGPLAGFKMNKQKRKMLTENMKIRDRTGLMNDTNFKTIPVLSTDLQLQKDISKLVGQEKNDLSIWYYKIQ